MRGAPVSTPRPQRSAPAWTPRRRSAANGQPPRPPATSRSRKLARRDREVTEAAAQEHLAAVRAEAADLERRREIAGAALTRMRQQLGEAIASLGESLHEPGLRLAPGQDAAS